MNSPLPQEWAVAAFGVSCLALLVAYLNFRRKSSLDLRASFSWVRSSLDASDQHISSVVIENRKDRAVIIFGIFLRVGHNFYIEVEDFEAKPLVLRAFESWHQEYGPIEYYALNGTRYDLNALFEDKRARIRVVLSTSDGKYVVGNVPKRWSPGHDFFKNHMTAIVRPMGVIYKGKAIGGNVPYVVDVLKVDGDREVITVHKRDYQVERFKNFRLTKESLESANALSAFLQHQVEAGTLKCQSVEVVDVEALRAKDRPQRQRPAVAKYVGYLTYKVLGRFGTMLLDRRMARSNRLRAARSEPSKAHSDKQEA